MPKSANHNIRVFVRRIHTIAICIVAECSSFNKSKEVADETVEKLTAQNGGLGYNC